MDKKSYIKKLLQDCYVPSSIIAMILVDLYSGMKWVDFDAATILLDLREDYGSICETNKEKVKAVQGLFASDLFSVDWVTFSNMVKILNDRIPAFNVPDPPRVHELIWAIAEADSIVPFDDDKFSKEVLTYIELVLDHFGFYEIPKELKTLDLNISLKTPEVINDNIKEMQKFKLSQVTEYISAKSQRLKKEYSALKDLMK